MADEIGELDLTAQASAAQTATNYITAISNDGIWVTPNDAKPSNGAATSTTTGWHISDSIELFKQGTSYMKMWIDNNVFAKLRIGKEDSGHLLLKDNGIDLYGSSTSRVASLGSGSMIIGDPAYNSGFIATKHTMRLTGISSRNDDYFHVGVRTSVRNGNPEIFVKKFVVNSNETISNIELGNFYNFVSTTGMSISYIIVLNVDGSMRDTNYSFAEVGSAVGPAMNATGEQMSSSVYSCSYDITPSVIGPAIILVYYSINGLAPYCRIGDKNGSNILIEPAGLTIYGADNESATEILSHRIRIGKSNSAHLIAQPTGINLINNIQEDVALFSTTVRLGKSDSSHIILSKNGLDIFDNTDSKLALEPTSNIVYEIDEILWSYGSVNASDSSVVIPSIEPKIWDNYWISAGTVSDSPDAKLLYKIGNNYYEVSDTSPSSPLSSEVYFSTFNVEPLYEPSCYPESTYIEADTLDEYVLTGKYGYEFDLYVQNIAVDDIVLATMKRNINSTMQVRVGSKTSGHTIVNDSGMEIFTNTNISIAQFGSTSRIGKAYVSGASDNESHVELDYHSLKLIDKEGDIYFHVSDLRDNSGTTKLMYLVYYRSTTVSYISVPIPMSDVVSIKYNNHGSSDISISDYTFTSSRITLTSPITFDYAGGYFKIEFYTTSPLCKAMTFGTRNTSVGIPGALSFSSGTNNRAEGRNSITFGYSCVASGANSCAIGASARANGEASFAEGNSSHADADYAHSEGTGCYSTGHGSHSEGINSNASGDGAHAEGNGTSAAGNYAHAEGASTVASGDRSHTQNRGTVAASENQTALGKYNAEDSNNTYAVIVGNGTANNARSNALAVEWNGTTLLHNPNIERGVVPSSSVYGGGGTLRLVDKNGLQIGYFQSIQLSDGTEGFQLGVSNSDSTDWNTIQLAFDSNDNPIVSVSDADKWRNALGITDSGWQTLTLGSAAKAYDSGTAPVYRKCFNVVNLVGAVSPKSQVAAGGEFDVGVLPDGYRPRVAASTVCQGSGNSVYLLRVGTNGNIRVERYRNGASANAAMSTTTWLPFNVTFICA